MEPIVNCYSIKQEILPFYEELTADRNHRYRSWEHCYTYFRRHDSLRTEAELDIGSLHLAFYLASWGMYRGSSALLWKDYKIHDAAVLKLLESQYSNLWNFNPCEEKNDAEAIEQIIKLYHELKQIYRERITAVNGKSKEHEASEILITKILLGTVGCTPACDRFFIRGFRHESQYSTFGKKFLLRAFQFYRQQADEFSETQRVVLQRGGINYPAMKLLDMYFWNLGVRLERQDQQEDNLNV